MAKPQTRKQFKEYCLRRLGWPVIEINVDDDQVDDRIDDALSFFHDYHWDGVEKIFMKHMITAEDINRRWIYCPDAVTFVTGIVPFDQSGASINMFDLRYQLRLHDLYDFTSVSYVSYEITMQHLRTLNLLFSGTPQFRFNRLQNKERDSSLGVQFRLYKHLQLCGYPVYPEEFKLAENTDSIHNHNKLWKLMVEGANDPEIYYIP